MKTYTIESMNEKVSGAFRELRKRNLLAHKNFLCCSKCASTELYEVAVEKNKRGYVYYHRQDTADIAKGNLCIRYCSAKDDENDTKEIGNIVVEELRKQGLEPEWNGDPSRVIELNWKVVE
jgi:hypothetical protein